MERFDLYLFLTSFNLKCFYLYLFVYNIQKWKEFD